jgi:hypothetical protein
MTFDKQKYWEERTKAKEPKPVKKDNPIMTELEIAILTVKKGTRNTKGAFGKPKLPYYKSLKVIPRSKRTPENCNEQGVANG